jgi:hypothetical protein
MGDGWFHEIKYDGYRLFARREAAGIRLLTRNGYDWTLRYPLIRQPVEALRCRSCLIDGEAVACDDGGVLIGYCTGKRDSETTDALIRDLRARVIGAPEISTDGLHHYKPAIRDAFRGRAAHGVVTKTYSVTHLNVNEASRISERGGEAVSGPRPLSHLSGAGA